MKIKKVITLRTALGILLLNVSHSICVSLYVSPSGNDNNSGTITQPLLSLKKAVELARGTSGPKIIYLREGTHYLSETLVLQPEDSGTPEFPLIFIAYQNEKPILSGAVPINSTWTTHQNGILKATIPDHNPKYPQLFINGKRQHLARYPNYDRNILPLNGFSQDALLGGQANAEPHAKVGAFMHSIMQTEWGSLHYEVIGVDPNSGNLTLTGGHQVGIPHSLFGGTENYPPDPNHRYIENLLEELDAPKEWYLDKLSNTLYTYPIPGTNLSTAKIELVMLKQLVEIKGSEANPVKHIHFQNLTFTQTSHIFLEPYEYQMLNDWKINRSGAVFLEGTENILIDQCHFDQVGGNAVFMSNYNRNNTVSNSVINYAGESGVCFVGDEGSVRSPSGWFNQLDILSDPVDKTPGPKSNNYPAQCKVHNNLMHDLGRIGKQTAGIYIHIAKNITASHNTLFNLPRAGIVIGTGHYGGNIVEFNDIFNTVQETGDHGPFNSWGRDRYWSLDFRSGQQLPVKQYALLDVEQTNIIRNNRFHHSGRWGIDLDDGSTNYNIYNNLCLGMGVKLREGFYRTLRNNIIIQTAAWLQVWPDSSDDIVANNIIVSSFPLQFTGGAGPEDALLIDSNLYYNFGNPLFIVGVGPNKTLAEWQAQGNGLGSKVGDPMFNDPGKGDYSPATNSPAALVGFKNFPMDRFGVIGPNWKAGDIHIYKNVNYGGSSGVTNTLMGASLENNPNGVLLRTVPPGSEALQFGFQQNDVIISVNCNPAENIETMLPLFELKVPGHNKIVVLRNGVEVEVNLPGPSNLSQKINQSFSIKMRDKKLFISSHFIENYSLQIFSIKGEEILATDNMPINNFISMESYPRGTYLLFIKSGGISTWIKKFALY